MSDHPSVPSAAPAALPGEEYGHVSYEWLRSRGFRLDSHHVDNVPHMVLRLDGHQHDECSLEVSPTHRVGYQLHEWHCWFRDDLSHRRARFVHLRHITHRDQLCALVAAITGKPLASCEWSPEKFASALEQERANCARRYREYCDGDRRPFL